jgi:hypothetical protein
MFDHFQLDAVLSRCLFSGLSGVALIHVSQLDVLLGDLLHLPGHLYVFGASLLTESKCVQQVPTTFLAGT